MITSVICMHAALEPVRLMPPIQQPNHTETDHECLVMQIMLPRRPHTSV